ncbi:MAG: hypothetical protein JNL70_14000 [Saprospiraceae bacterium]|nr:hypothetical protein [Saprospiraceae bacterium]
MTDFELYEKIETYLKGQLTPEQHKAFEIEIANDHKLAELVDMHRFEWDAMEVIIEKDLRNQMAQWKKEGTPSVKEEKKSTLHVVGEGTTIRRLYYTLVAAASVAVVAGAVWWLWFRNEPKQNIPTPPIAVSTDTTNKTKEQNPSPQYTVPPTEELVKKDTKKQAPLPPKVEEIDENIYRVYALEAYEKNETFTYEETRTSRGEQTENNSLDIAGKAFDKKDYSKAINLLKNTPATDENFVALEILAHSYFQTKNYKAALPIFQNLLILSGRKSREKSDWYLLLCYLANYKQHKTQFNSLTQNILSNKDHAFYNDVLELSQKVKN